MDHAAAAELARARPSIARAEKHLRRARQQIAQAADAAGVLEVRDVHDLVDVAELSQLLTDALAVGSLHVVVLRGDQSAHSPSGAQTDGGA